MIALILLGNILFAETIRVAAAANVSYAMEDLKQAFGQMHPETNLEVILASSGKLAAQIMHGAPYDVFLSADMKYPERLYIQQIALTKPIIYAQGTLAILSQKKRDFHAGISVLQEPDIKKIAIANPQTAPYGIAAKEALQHTKLYENLKDKFVYGESIAQTFSFAMKAADMGIVATSALHAPQMSHYKEAIRWSEIDTSLYTPIKQGMVILQHAKESAEAKAFYDFMLSSKAKEILRKFGYRVE